MFQNFGGQQPAAPQLPVRPVVIGYANTMAQSILNTTANMSQQNPIRGHVHWLLSANNGNNPAFTEFLITALDYMDYLMHAQRMMPEQAMAHSVTELLAMFSADQALRNQQLLAGFTPQSIQEMQQQCANYMALGQQINAFMQAQQPQQGYNPGYNPGYTGGAAFTQPAGFHSHVTGGGGGYQHAGYAAQRSAQSMGVRPGTSSTPTFDRQYGGATAPINATQSTPFKPAPKPFVAAPAVAPAATSPFLTNNGQAIQLPAAPDIVGVSTVNAPFIQQLDGCGITHTRTTGREWTRIFDPTDTVAVFTPQADGTFIDEYLKKSEITVDYQDHKCEHYFAPQTAEDVNHRPDTALRDHVLQEAMSQLNVKQLLADLKKRESTDLQVLSGNDLELPKYSIVLDKPVVCGSAEDFQSELIMALIERDIGPSVIDVDQSSFQYIHERYFKWILTGEQSKLAQNIKGSRSWGDMRTRLLKLRVLPDSYFRTLNEAVTAQINEFLSIGLGIPSEDLSISSFCLDIDELLTILKEDYSDEEYKAFEEAYAIVKDTTLKAYHGEDYVKAIGQEGMEEAERATIVGYGVATDVTLLPLHSRDLSLAGFGANYGHAGILHASAMPKLYNLVHQRLTKQPKSGYRHTIIVTSDGAVLRCHQALLGNTILVSRG